MFVLDVSRRELGNKRTAEKEEKYEGCFSHWKCGLFCSERFGVRVHQIFMEASLAVGFLYKSKV